jgi:hypothetical protein
MPAPLTLQIEATETPSGWCGQWSRDDQPVGEPIVVQDQDARAMADLERRFLDLFEQGGRPRKSAWATAPILHPARATWRSARGG